VVKKEPACGSGNHWVFSELGNFLHRLKTNTRKQVERRRASFHRDSEAPKKDEVTHSLRASAGSY